MCPPFATAPFGPLHEEKEEFVGSFRMKKCLGWRMCFFSNPGQTRSLKTTPSPSFDQKRLQTHVPHDASSPSIPRLMSMPCHSRGRQRVPPPPSSPLLCRPTVGTASFHIRLHPPSRNPVTPHRIVADLNRPVVVPFRSLCLA